MRARPLVELAEVMAKVRAGRSLEAFGSKDLSPEARDRLKALGYLN